jgi:iron complex transport system ATP-binding protein
MTAPLVAVRDLSLRLGPRAILDDVSFDIGSGEFVALLGRNGAGKTSLLRAMLGLLRSSGGEILLSGTAIDSIRRREIARLIAYVPQSHVPAFPYTVYDVVAMGRSASSGWGRKLNASDEKIVEESLAELGVRDFSNRVYAELSGGERQAVLVARALAQRAKIILMDEPTSSLDVGQRARLMSVLSNLTRSGCAICVSLHYPELALQWFSRAILLHEGRILGDGKPADVLTETTLSELYGVPVACIDTAARVFFSAKEYFPQ